jgi:eukaryotic-like serine/threonine-protein kinase
MQNIFFKKVFKILSITFVIGIILFILIDKVLMPYYVQKGKTTKVPETAGMPLEDPKKTLRAAGLEPREAEYKTDKRYKIGTVTMQNPAANTEVKLNRNVYLTISGGEELISVPNLKGKSIREATFNLERCGLKIGEISFEPSDEIFANTIIRQDIMPSTKVRSDSRIHITVSQGKASDRHIVPDVTLKTLTETEKILIDAGFQVGKITYQTNADILPNTILEQYPRAGEMVPFGQAIDLIVAQKTPITKEEN